MFHLMAAVVDLFLFDDDDDDVDMGVPVPRNNCGAATQLDVDDALQQWERTTTTEAADLESSEFEWQAAEPILQVKYEEELGRGGIGAIVVGYLPSIDEKVAIKVPLAKGATELDAEVVRVQYRNEEQMLRYFAHNPHPHVMGMHLKGARAAAAAAAAEASTMPLIVMPCLAGDLLTWLATNTEATVDTKLRLSREMLSGVGHIHAHGYAHLDLSVENIMVSVDATGSARAVVGDFGSMQRCTPDLHCPRQATMAVKQHYAAPEIVHHKPFLSQASDMFAVGVVLVALWCGTFPFTTAAVDDMYYMRVQHRQLDVTLRESSVPIPPQPVLNLIHDLLRASPASRPTATAALLALVHSE